MTKAIALALAAGVPAANAQTAANRDTRSLTAHEPFAQSIQPDEIRASKLIGSAVYDVHNRKIGGVADVILNKDGKVDAVVIAVLGVDGKNVAFAPNELKTDNDGLTLDCSEEQLQQMPNYDLAKGNTGAGT
jgi:sporulation protein YlmC with PRC-barrel domain